jgi:hypothetical protein
MPGPRVSQLIQDRFADLRPLVPQTDRWLLGVQRDLLDMAHGRWLWSQAARERWRRREAEATTLALKLKRTAKTLACYPFANRVGLRVLEAAHDATTRWLSSTNPYERLLRDLQPSLVFNASHVHGNAGLAVVRTARWLGIPTATFIFSWDNLTSQGRIVPQYDYYLVWNELVRQQLLDIYPDVRPDRVFVTGTPQFDFHFRPEFHWSRETFCRHVGADPRRPIVLYTTGMANHMPGEPALVEELADILASLTDLGSPQLIVRVYPKDRTGRFEALKQRGDILVPSIPWDPAWLTPEPEDGYLLTNLLRHAALGVNVASTVSLELCMFDKPVINIGYNPPGVETGGIEYTRYYDFDHYRPLVESGAVSLARSADQLRALLREHLSRPRGAADQRQDLLKRFFDGTLDGGVARRIASRLVDLTAGRSG